MLQALGASVAIISLVLSVTTAWLTLGRRGRVRVAQPPTVYFGPDGAREAHPKVFVRLLMYSTAVRGRIVEGMFARLHRGDSSQTFSVWVSGQGREELTRGAGMSVRPEGIARDHHFLLPRDGTTYSYLAGHYKLEVNAVLVGRSRPVKLVTVELQVSEAQADRLKNDKTAGLYFDWSPETRCYTSHIDNARLRDPAPFFVLTERETKPVAEPPRPEESQRGNYR